MHLKAGRSGRNYEAHNAPAYKYNTSATSFGFGNPDFVSATDILAIGGHLPVFWPYFSVKIRFRYPDFPKGSNNLASRRRFQVFFHCTDRKRAIFLFRVYLT